MSGPLVFRFDGRTIVYQDEAETVLETRPGVSGGQVRVVVPTGKTVKVARVFGTKETLPLTPELQAAIDAELARLAGKGVVMGGPA